MKAAKKKATKKKEPLAPKRDMNITITIPMSRLISVSSNDGGYLGIDCLVCGATGYIRESSHGYRFGTPLGPHHMSNDMTHKKTCDLNQYINKTTGKLICL